MSDLFTLWAVTTTGRDPDDDFDMAETELQVLEADVDLMYGPRGWREEDGVTGLPVGAKAVLVKGCDIMEQVEINPGLYGWSQHRSIPDPKFPAITIWKFKGDIPGLTQVVQHNAYFPIAAEAGEGGMLPPAWEDRTVNSPFPVDVFATLKTKVVGVCEADQKPLVAAWFDNLIAEYTNQLDEFSLTPRRWDVELGIYTS